MTGVQTCALPICFPVTILEHEEKGREEAEEDEGKEEERIENILNFTGYDSNKDLKHLLYNLYIDKEVLSAKIKLERSIATKRDLKVGEIIKEEDLHLLSPGDGYKWSQRNEIVGKTLKIEVPKNELIYPDMINNI